MAVECGLRVHAVALPPQRPPKRRRSRRVAATRRHEHARRDAAAAAVAPARRFARGAALRPRRAHAARRVLGCARRLCHARLRAARRRVWAGHRRRRALHAECVAAGAQRDARAALGRRALHCGRLLRATVEAVPIDGPRGDVAGTGRGGRRAAADHAVADVCRVLGTLHHLAGARRGRVGAARLGLIPERGERAGRRAGQPTRLPQRTRLWRDQLGGLPRAAAPRLLLLARGRRGGSGDAARPDDHRRRLAGVVE
mmetsp:Transcript_2/g.10  ORF Transcript_2/g.10 Transcript_2/m.10 type:complete len:256 (-) Transcript_2:343-1110(-)